MYLHLVKIMTRLIFALLGLILSFLPVAAEPKTVLALGDSLTAGLGVEPQEAFPAQLEKALKARGHDTVVVNGGVSGDTAADGLARLDWSLTDDVDAVIIELGANDALRGLDPKQAEAALDAIIGKLQAKNLPVFLAGMRAPPNLGPDYATAFDGMYARLAESHGVPLYPFFLEGVAAQPNLNQADGMHPTAAGVGIIIQRMMPVIEPFITSLK